MEDARRFLPKLVELSDWSHTAVPQSYVSKDCDDGTSSTECMISCMSKILFAWLLPIKHELLGLASIIHVLLDPLFLYVPLLNEDFKCVMVDNNVTIAALVLRSYSDIHYLVRIIARIKDAYGWAVRRESQTSTLRKIAMSIAFHILSILPIPQVVVLKFLPNIRDSNFQTMKLLNTLIVLQYLARVYPMYCEYKVTNETEHAKKDGYRFKSKRFKILMNFFAFLLAGHVIGAFWYFFSIQREIDCWRFATRVENGSGFSASCDQNTFRNVTLINELCPIMSPDVSKFDFGIFLYALQSHMQESTGFPQKLFQCFSWGLRHLSSFASDLNTSTYEWENLFVVSISISGLLLFIYLLGNMQIFMQGMTISSSLQRKMETIKPKLRQMVSDYHLPKEMESNITRLVEELLKKDEHLIVENMFSILCLEHIQSSDVGAQTTKDLALDIKCGLFMDKLKKVDGLKDKAKNLCELLQPMIYNKGHYIIRQGEPLDMMFFIIAGDVLIFATNDGEVNAYGSSGTILLQKDKDGLYGKELLTWGKGPSSDLSNLPISDRTVKSHNKVEVFALQATDLQRVLSKSPSQIDIDMSMGN